ncbi:heavy metal translocating P-type ATPase [Olsenella sp. HMSC062G07]|uniref:heavy metal translocating P-type ATPase n=1 Tax=Olsenella sp. HMSC062G07 TaxID=1739330 RepID=UPI0008A5D4D9|nr:heavy metal translocating P-type ATPase [Olsenella sp. HMSC062G07]OFK23193.1 cation transporter [Olsenella sp. HMSC062G07]
MYYHIAHEMPGRLRLVCGSLLFSDQESLGLSCALMQHEHVLFAEVHPANGSIVITHMPGARDAVLGILDALEVDDLPVKDVQSVEIPLELQVARENNEFALHVGHILIGRAVGRLLLPAPLGALWTLVRAVPIIMGGMRRLVHGSITVDVLDAAAVGAFLLKRSFSEVASIVTLIGLSARLQEHVEKRMRLALEEGIITRAATAWRTVDGTDVEIAMEEVQEGDVLHLLCGSVLPVDGTVVAGEGEVDEASLTGESRLVNKAQGATIYAGTALENGELYVRVVSPPGKARIDEIVTLVSRSSALKASVQSKAEHMADALVPYSFLAFFSVLALTRTLTKALVVLMVDYSCAVRLSTPICVMSAMNEAVRNRCTIKGGKYLEALAYADTIVFDKTGTLTLAQPTLSNIVPFSDLSEGELLRYAACIEEHFPHSMARALVEAAKRQELVHQEELHARVEYVVAHGIVTTIDGKRACIGSEDFIFMDEGVEKPANLDQVFADVAPDASRIYLSIGGEFVGAFCITDAIRPEAKRVIRELHDLGISRVVMLTGDAETSAQNVADALGIDVFHARVAPEEKSAYIKRLRDEGHVVIMVGDGINDSPALATAHVSVAMSDASDIARAVADVSIMNTSLDGLVYMRTLAQRSMRRIRTNYAAIIAGNSALMVLGVLGLMSVGTAAYIHNLSTFAVAAASTCPYLGRER